MGRKPSAATLYKRSVTYPDYILNGIIPYMETIIDEVKPILENVSDITKEQWEILYKHAIKFCEISEVPDFQFISTFHKSRIESVKYKKEHSSYYESVAFRHVMYALNKLNMEKDGNTEFHQFYMYNAALHIFYFVACPEKI
ncbi:MAG: hypothetical protein [Wendovervirus sonii]|uniref:Uncharacterized protein n=1 Tax=phage Lak_Megaphage_Sonny TaxID=3109229 RepID=A0ABZ0Z309_9CAUD|nr:MAG: hypothetical protein [phage Lak_Megaphage_Sonny]